MNLEEREISMGSVGQRNHCRKETSQYILKGGSKSDIWVWKERCEHIYGGGSEHGVIYLHGAE